MKKNIERVIGSLFDDHLKEFRTENLVDESFLALCNDYKPVCIEALSESIDESMEIFLQYLYENQDGMLASREHARKNTVKIRIK